MVATRGTRFVRFVVAVSLIIASSAFASALAQQNRYDLVVVQVPATAEPGARMLDRLQPPLGRYSDGTRIVLVRGRDPNPIVLTPEFVAACDPDVSPDGRTILFSGRRGADDSWQIWRMNADGSHKVQITHGDGDNVTPVFAGSRFYLNDSQPTPQIIYAGTGHGWANEQASGPALALFGTDHQGAAVRRLTFNLNSDYSPDVLHDGRIVFTSWQHYGTRYPPDGTFALMGVNLDGTDLMPYYGNHEPPLYKDMIHVSDFDDRVYFVESDRYTWLGGGDIALVSRRRPLHSYRKLSHDAGGRYHSPAPLPDGGLIASYRPDTATAVFALYRVDQATGIRRDKIYEERGWHTIDAQLLVERPAIKGRANWLIPGSTTGVFYCLNSYRTNLPGGENVQLGAAKYVRVIEGIPRVANIDIQDLKPGLGSGYEPYRDSGAPFGQRRLLGLAPVAEDGSFHVRVPAETPITFQLLDKDYLALRTQHGWIWVMGNENRGCIGCHEDRELSPPNRLAAAVIKPPVELTLPPERRRTVDFRHQIAPIIASSCVKEGCHVGGRAAPDLSTTHRPASRDPSELVYRTLLDPIRGRGDERYVVPGQAIESPLIWLLFGRRMGSQETRYTGQIEQMPPHDLLRERERILIIEWIDFGAQWDASTPSTENRD